MSAFPLGSDLPIDQSISRLSILNSTDLRTYLHDARLRALMFDLSVRLYIFEVFDVADRYRAESWGLDDAFSYVLGQYILCRLWAFGTANSRPRRSLDVGALTRYYTYGDYCGK